MPKRIDFEAHFLVPSYVKFLYEYKGYPRMEDDGSPETRRLVYSAGSYEPFGPRLFDRLMDLGEGRIKLMDQFGIDVQVLSISAPGYDPVVPEVGVPAAIKTNDELAAAISAYPDRMKGFASLCVADPEAAVKELERCVKELGFIGWKTHSNFGDGGYIDEKKYWPILAKAEELNVPIYLHPCNPNIPQLQTYGFALAGAPFGFGVECAMASMRLILSGALDAFPKLRIMLGHFGEGLPFIIKRVNFAYVRKHFDAKARPDIKKLPGDYIKDNFWVTTSGNTLDAAFVCTRDTMGLDRILLGCDYPYEDLEDITEFMEKLPISQEDKDRVYGINAQEAGFIEP